MTKKTSPGTILGSIFSKSVGNFENIRNESFLEFHLVFISGFIIFVGQKLRKLQIADFEQIWDFFQFFQFLTVLSTIFWKVICSNNSHKATESIDVFRFQKLSTVFEVSYSKGKISSFYMYQDRKWTFCGKKLRIFFHLECFWSKKY